VSDANLAMAGHSGELLESSPFGIPSKKLAIWLFIIADGMTFAAVLIAYGFLRNASTHWPYPFHDPVNVAVMTFILISSSMTMLMGVLESRAGRRKQAVMWMWLTAVGGAIFAGFHIREWLRLIAEGMTPYKNPWGDPVFGASFYGVTGLHLLHVVGGVLVMIGVTLAYNKGTFTADHVETTALYWHFVDLVWMFVVPFIYLLNFSR